MLRWGLGSPIHSAVPSLYTPPCLLSRPPCPLSRLTDQLQSFGVAGVVSYGLLNTLYYTAAILFVL